MRTAIEIQMICLIMVICILGCKPQFVWDDNAQRCRDTASGQWTEDANCQK